MGESLGERSRLSAVFDSELRGRVYGPSPWTSGAFRVDMLFAVAPPTMSRTNLRRVALQLHPTDNTVTADSELVRRRQGSAMGSPGRNGHPWNVPKARRPSTHPPLLHHSETNP